MRYALSQIAIFFIVSFGYSLLRPHLDFVLPAGKWWVGYGALLISPLIISWQDKKFFFCMVVYASAWVLNRYISAVDTSYLGHVPGIYAAIGLICLTLKKKGMATFCFAIAGYCFLLGLLHWSTRPTLSHIEILVYNLMYAGPLLTRAHKKKGGGSGEAKAIHSDPHFQQKAA